MHNIHTLISNCRFLVHVCIVHFIPHPSLLCRTSSSCPASGVRFLHPLDPLERLRSAPGWWNVVNQGFPKIKGIKGICPYHSIRHDLLQ